MPLVIAVLAVAAYANVLRAPFVLDDDSIVDDPTLRTFWPPRFLAGTTRPLVQLSLASNYALGGFDVWGYHAFNVVIHVLAAVTLFGLVRRTLLTADLRRRYGTSSVALAFAVAAIWAVHPLQTASVAYVSQRAEALMALFYLLTLYAVVRATDSARPRAWQGAALAACALGMVSKPVMVTAPLAVLLYDRVFLAGSWSGAWRQRRGLYVGLAMTWVILLVLLSGRHESETTAGLGMRGITVPEYAGAQPGVILRYLQLALWPHGLVLDYAWPLPRGLGSVVVPGLMIGAILVLTVFGFRRRPALGVLGAFFFLALAPSSSIVPIKDLAFEHRMYLPLAPLVVLAVFAVHRLLRDVVADRIGTALLCAILAALALLTARRNDDYGSLARIWADVVAKRPDNARAHNNLGFAFFAGGQAEQAMAHYREALRLDPAYADAENNLGRALAELGSPDEAIAHYRAALRLNPDGAEAHNNLGIVLFRKGAYDDALLHYAQALQLKPLYSEAHNNAGVALAATGRYEEAKAHYAEAIRLNPAYAEAYSNLGNTLLRQGDAAAAVAQYANALRIAPDFAQVHINMALALEALGNNREAANHRAEAVRLAPSLGTVP